MQTAYEAGPRAKNKEEAANTEDTLRVSPSETAAPAPEKRTTEEVRQGHTGDHLRYILTASLAGVVAVFIVIFLLFMS